MTAYSMKLKWGKLARRAKRVRAKIKGTKEIPRFSVYRSLKHIYASLIDDEKGRTLAAVSDLQIKKSKIKNSPFGRSPEGRQKSKIAYEVGKVIAQKAKELKITAVVFDRGGRKYHGRIKALAEGAREAGLKF